MTTTVASAVTMLRERLNESTAAQWPDLQLRRWLNEGIRDIARRTRLYTDQTTQAITANVQEYTLNADVLAIEHAIWKATAETRKIPLEARAFSSVQRWINETSPDPVYYTTYGHPPTLKLQLYPTPTRAGSFFIYGPKLPVAMDVATGTGNIDVIEGWLEPALDYAEYMAQRKDKDSTAWKDTFQLYEQKVAQMTELWNTDDAPGEFQFTGQNVIPTWLSDFD